jgi:hypothetical protein
MKTENLIKETLEFLQKSNAYVHCWKDDPADGWSDNLLWGFMTNQYWVYNYGFQVEDVIGIQFAIDGYPSIHIKSNITDEE